jgi:glycosyltransferase involved in cell wall biosynthesis
MPCLNEGRTLAVCIEKARRSLDEAGVSGEIVVADNGSSDGSPEIAADLGARVITVQERGYGAALAGGIRAARGTYVIMGDADDSYDFEKLGPFIEQLRLGNDLVLGNRFAGGIEPEAMPRLHQLGNPLLSRIGRRLFGVPSGDIYCGLRGFKRSSIERLGLQSTGMEFAIEMVVKATLAHLRIAEVPTTLSPDGRDRPPHLRTWRDGWRSLRFLLLYSPRWLFLYPGFLLMLIGLIVGIALLPGQLSVGQVKFDAHTLLYAGAAIVIGYQCVLFSVFARVFAANEGLLPESSLLDRLLTHFRLERGLAVGGTLVALGLAGSIYALVVWQRHTFGPLPYASELRLVIPSAVMLMIGSQTILASLFISILNLKRR